MEKRFLLFVLISSFTISVPAQTIAKASSVKMPGTKRTNNFYAGNKAPLLPAQFIKLPIKSIQPQGWILKALELQRDGLAGNLGNISAWLTKTDNAWLHKDGKGKWGWEEVPYWLKGYANMGYILRDEKMITEAKFWIDAVLNNQREDGDFGPIVLREGKRDLWTNMPMLWCLQSYYDYSGDERVISFLTKYFKWQSTIPDSLLLEDFWEKSRGGDNMLSVYWLYNHTGDKELLKFASTLDRNTADWRQKDNLPNWHNVNIAQSFREPATYYLQSHKKADLDATYNDFKLVRQLYGQVPGGMWGGDENSRTGYDDPHQGVETCGMVEQMTSDQFLLRFTGDTFWADNCEDVAFNTFPAAFMPDYRSLRYLTAPNMVISDSKNHSPGLDNSGPFLMMNPFSSRCCQHNHSSGWAYYVENSWMATPDNGLAAQLYIEGTVNAKVGDGTNVQLVEETHYPFEDKINFTVKTNKKVGFPVYLRVPAWCKDASVTVNGKSVAVDAIPGNYIKLEKQWSDGDKIQFKLPMLLRMREWTENKNSVSINYGPLTFSLKIEEKYVQQDTKETAIGDSKWQENADARAWPSFEIYPASDWNYGLLLDKNNLLKSFSIKRNAWPADNYPFTNKAAPLELIGNGKQISSWVVDQHGLCAVVPQSPVKSDADSKQITLVPMGGARLRISSFPVIAP